MAVRYIRAIYHRRASSTAKSVAWTRYYRDVTTAAAKATASLIIDGDVGDVIEFVLTTNEMTVGAIKMTATGRILTEWVPDEAYRMIRQVLQDQAVAAQEKYTREIARLDERIKRNSKKRK